MRSYALVAADPMLARYVEQVRKFPMLSEEGESELITRWVNDGDVSAAHTLVTSHLRLVLKIALQFRNYGLPIMDIISEGTVGLMKAVKKFRPEKGKRLSTYAVWWIKAAVREYITKSWSMLKGGVNALRKKLSFENTKCDARGIDTESDDRVCHEYFDHGCNMISLNSAISDNDEREVLEFIEGDECVYDETLASTQETNRRLVALNRAMESLSERERDIVKHRRLVESPVTLDVLSKKYGVSKERARQIEAAAVEKIKNLMLLSEEAQPA